MNAILTELYSAFLPTLLQIIGAVLMAILIRATEVARARWGIEIEARHREALHSALMSGIRAALSRGSSPQEAIAAAVQHAAQSVPDAIMALQPDSGVLSSIAEAKLREVLDAALPQIQPSALGGSMGGGMAVLTAVNAALAQGSTGTEVTR
jgi:hypothetical protein